MAFLIPACGSPWGGREMTVTDSRGRKMIVTDSRQWNSAWWMYQTRSLSGPQAKTLKMEAACSNEASSKLHTSTRCNKAHNILTLSMCRRENFELKN